MSTAGLLGRIAVEEGMITRDQLRRATRAQGRHPDKRLGELLVDLGYIDEGQLGALLAMQARAADSRPVRRPTPPPIKQAVPEAATLGAIALKRVSAAEFAADQRQQAESPRRKDGAEARGWLLGLLSDAMASGASDVLVIPDQPVRLRRFGRVHDFTTGPVSASGARRLLAQTLSDEDLAELERVGHVNVFFEAPAVGRFRLQVHNEVGGMGGTFHRTQLGDLQPGFEELGLPNLVAGLTNHAHGLILVTGTAGSGRSTTMGALVNLICEERNDHVVVVETPRELRPVVGEAIVTQMEVGIHCASIRDALHDAPRMDTNVICVDELPTDAMYAALQAADTDQLVIATLRAPTSARALERLVDSCPHRDRRAAGSLVADCVRAVICQRLVPAMNREGTEEIGVILALELIHVDDEIRELIRDGQISQISQYVQSERPRGSMVLDTALAELLRLRRITMDTARSYARHPAKFAPRERGT